jgi:multidrug efflux pump subunit AcrA (membrane-fusion protein)
MTLKKSALVALVLVVLGIAAVVLSLVSSQPDSPSFVTAKAARHDIRLVVSTNGIIEPVDRSEIYAPLDGFVTSIQKKEGSEILHGQLLLRLQSDQVRSALAEANAALLGAKRQARTVEMGPSREELTELDSSIAETALQLNHQNKDLAVEESLFAKQATPRMSVENLRKQGNLLQLRLDSLKQKKQDLLARYSTEDKELEKSRISELTKQAESSIRCKQSRDHMSAKASCWRRYTDPEKFSSALMWMNRTWAESKRDRRCALSGTACPTRSGPVWLRSRPNRLWP